MPVSATNLIQGPGTLYTGAFGATEPLDTAINTTPSASTWTDAGGTNDGVELTFEQEFAELEVDQITWVVGRRRTKNDAQIKTNLAEPTLENFAIALNGGTSSASAAFKTFEPLNDTSATQPTYRAVILDGYAPQTAAALTMRRRVIVRKVLSIENIESSYKKDDMTLYPVTFGAHYVSSVIAPFKKVDQLT